MLTGEAEGERILDAQQASTNRLDLEPPLGLLGTLDRKRLFGVGVMERPLWSVQKNRSKPAGEGSPDPIQRGPFPWQKLEQHSAISPLTIEQCTSKEFWLLGVRGPRGLSFIPPNLFPLVFTTADPSQNPMNLLFEPDPPARHVMKGKHRLKSEVHLPIPGH